MRTDKIEIRIKDFLCLYLEGKATIEEELRYLAETFKRSTVSCYVTRYRKAFEGIGLDKGLFSLGQEFYNESKANKVLALKEKLTHKNSVNLSSIQEVIETLKTGSNLDMLIWCALVSGRRFIEIIKTGIFKGVSELFECKFSGIAKQVNHEDKVIQIPLMVSFGEFIVVLKKLRYNLESKYKISTITNVEVNDRLSKSIQRHISINKSNLRLLDEIDTFKDLRTIYGKYMSMFKKPKEIDSVVYVGEILGHSTLDFATVLHYRGYNIIIS